MANAAISWKDRRDTMTSDPRYRALFLGAGPQMNCGVGQFTRLLCEAVERIDPGSSTTLTLTRSEGSIAEIWRAVGSARSVVCNFPIVAWKRVMFAPLLAMANASNGARITRFQATIGKLQTTLRTDPTARQISAGDPSD